MPKPRSTTRPAPAALLPLPISPEEVAQRGWDGVDVVFVTGDAYVDHPSFAMALLGRVMEDAGYRVAILSQPDWRSCEPWRQFGRPRLCFAVSAGNMDSMINHYTANRKVRNDDAYSPDGEPGRRPDRATLAYCQRAREAFPGVPVLAGGIEASLRRLAHYDYWSDKVRQRSIVLDSKADLVVFGMGEQGAAGDSPPPPPPAKASSRFARCAARPTRLGSSQPPPRKTRSGCRAMSKSRRTSTRCRNDADRPPGDQPLQHRQLVQYHGGEGGNRQSAAVSVGRGGDRPRVRAALHARPHPSYGERPIPAPGGRSSFDPDHPRLFWRLRVRLDHRPRGRIIQSRSERSILAEIRRLSEDPPLPALSATSAGRRRACTG